jgi:hypothetical protein
MPLVAAAALAAGAALQSATGFGFALIAAPLVFAAVDSQEAVGLMIALGTEVSLLTLFTERRRPQPVVRDCAVVLACALPGAVAGVAVLRALDPVALQVAVPRSPGSRQARSRPRRRPPGRRCWSISWVASSSRRRSAIRSRSASSG